MEQKTDQKTKNLYIFTGKGGVGKTIVSIAFAKHLKSQGKKVVYISFLNHSMEEQTFTSESSTQLCYQAGVDFVNLDLKACATEYMGKKLGSTLVANWIAKTPFFKALINMIPGFNYLIFMGKILEMIKDSGDQLICIVDSPSSGHALTMMEATKNFKDIFQSGLVFDDASKMLSHLTDESFTKITVLTLATEMAVTESRELKQELAGLGQKCVEIVSNNSLASFYEEIEQNAPDFLKEKLKNEREVLASLKDDISFNIPHIFEQESNAIINQISPLMKNLV